MKHDTTTPLVLGLLLGAALASGVWIWVIRTDNTSRHEREQQNLASYTQAMREARAAVDLCKAQLNRTGTPP